MAEVTRASGVAVTLPDTLALADQAAPAQGGRRRRQPPSGVGRSINAPPPRSQETETILGALADQGIEIVDEVPIGSTVEPTMPSGRRTRGAPAVPAQATARLALDLAAGEDAVVLLEQDGVYSWSFPVVEVTPAVQARRGGAARPQVRRAVFTLEVRATETAAQRRSRGIFSRVLLGPVKAIVLKFTAKVVLGKVMTYLEKDARRGLVRMDSPDPTSWDRIDSIDPGALPSDRPARILLWVHGTFSSTVGGFGPLAATHRGRALLAAAQSSYDAVIGFDHPTLSLDPLENATDLLQRLRLGELPHPPVIDAVAHSRGGLVLRSLIEHLLPQQPRGATVERAIFVACTHGGTQLAEPENWKALIDLYTNLAVAGSRALAVLPGAAIAGAVLAEVIRGIGAFAKYLVTQGISADGIPGLYAMAPTGPFVSALAARQPGQPEPGDASYYVIKANYETNLGNGDSPFPARLKAMLSDGFVDQLMMGVPNDLVVDVASMTAIDPDLGTFVTAEHDFGNTATIFHTVYFAQDTVASLIGDWIQIDWPATAKVRPGGHVIGGEVEAIPRRRVERRDRRRNVTREPPVLGGIGAAMPQPAPPPPRATRGTQRAKPPVPAPPTSRRRAPRPGSPLEAAKTRVLAEMPSQVMLGETASVQVRVSREALTAAAGTVSGGAAAELADDRPLILQVIAKAHFEIVSDSRVEVPVPKAGDPELQVFFDVEPTHAGKGELWIIARQGQIPIMTLTLSPTIAAKRSASRLVRPVEASASAADAAPQREQLRMLRISEEERGNDRLYRFQIEVPDLDIYSEFTSPLIVGDRVAYVKSLYKRIEDRWLSSDKDVENFQQELRAFGVELLDNLIPPELQGILWKNRKRLHGIMATCTEPFIPWELVHLKDPNGKGLPRETAFLGQMGLVRWLYVGWPPKTLRLRPGKARYIIPEYPDPEYALPETAEESAFLQATFGATAVSPRSKDLRALLSKPGRFDLLHFAGHGLADVDNISEASILLEGRMEDGAYVRDAFSASTVKAFADLDENGDRPIVVLNACQAGRAGYQLTNTGGFSSAFLEQGAGLFISSLWSVDDASARSFVETFYDGLRSGMTVAEATTSGRAKASDDGDATWLAYAVYGHPLAVLAT